MIKRERAAMGNMSPTSLLSFLIFAEILLNLTSLNAFNVNPPAFHSCSQHLLVKRTREKLQHCYSGSKINLRPKNFQSFYEYEFGDEESKLPGIGCILVRKENVILPGMKRTVHLYDTNLLEVFEHARRFDDNAFNMITYHSNSSTFQISDAGCLVKIIGWKRHEHENKLGETSPSYLVDVVGIKQITTGDILQYEPHLRINLKEPLPDSPIDGLGEKIIKLQSLSQKCEELAAALGLRNIEEEGTLEGCMNEVLSYSETGKIYGPNQNSVSSPHLIALISAQLLDKEDQCKALAKPEPVSLTDFVILELEERYKMLLAMKSLEALQFPSIE